jgi:long-chain acyl-CoA synthetase
VDEANRAVSRAESIRGFRVLPTGFSQANGELTANLKLRRNVVGKTRAAEIVAIYGD